jgi:hypothetical protein
MANLIAQASGDKKPNIDEKSSGGKKEGTK